MKTKALLFYLFLSLLSATPIGLFVSYFTKPITGWFMFGFSAVVLFVLPFNCGRIPEPDGGAGFL